MLEKAITIAGAMSCPSSAPSDFPVPCDLARNRAFSHDSMHPVHRGEKHGFVK